MAYSEEVKKLAETLKSSGLAASMTDALERAQSMIGKAEEPKEEPFEKKEDASQVTLEEIKEPVEKETVEESPEVQEELKKEEVFTNKTPENSEEKQEGLNQKKIDYSKEKKVDLNEVFNVNK